MFGLSTVTCSLMLMKSGDLLEWSIDGLLPKDHSNKTVINSRQATGVLTFMMAFLTLPISILYRRYQKLQDIPTYYSYNTDTGSNYRSCKHISHVVCRACIIFILASVCAYVCVNPWYNLHSYQFSFKSV